MTSWHAPTARRPPGSGNVPPRDSAYVAGLKMLGRRELSEAQVRERLVRRGHLPDDIELAVERLKTQRAIDDVRVAQAIAHTETSVKRRGRLGVKRQIEQAGIARQTAEDATEGVFSGLDNDAFMAAALARRLRGDRQIADDREFHRLYRYLLTQGFESDLVLKLLRARRGPR